MATFRFAARSEDSLRSVDERLAKVLRQALALEVIDFAVIEGHRDQAAQDAAVRKGTSQVRWPKGKHNAFPSLAADLLPIVPPGVEVYSTRALPYWHVLAGAILTVARYNGVGIRWGGDWDGDRDLTEEKFLDLGHFELVSAAK
jgi:peptidoglycan LD-endopeptidase CwlK